MSKNFLSPIWIQSEIFRENIKNGDEPPKTTEFLCLLVQSCVEERFRVFVSLGSAALHHFLSRLKTRAWTLPKPVSIGAWNHFREDSLCGGTQSGMELRAGIAGLLVLASVFPPAGKNRYKSQNPNFPDWKSSKMCWEQKPVQTWNQMFFGRWKIW